MTIFKPGEVVLVPFPFTDWSNLKQRPALIISSQNFNRRQSDVILCAITSHIPEKFSPEEYFLPKTDQISAGLLKPSIVKIGKIITLNQTLVRKTLGKISKNTLREIFKGVYQILKNE
ncbi:MAG: type II toxin-antitoxin system PemK/MazF family toxin [Candidatus Nealsonbacteria bacterium CG08_land_8_20_14_0_20_38_20]|uniref:Type II toxin-antitoxin system PemK/MazF family toxin n=1 Tax=Candidatus Nealsonbacteria bacterium CG08_land_8_20_14_0_20_38_20 TaxID=1974705 RepID=A0A2H0YLF2_9BACT|nr:MAG: type II toxin-antitoxin system PemK/MazF family toxin [Candidatus Nealsonbacteria bacterium CG08_land_8_20_14_0_20_38_20]